MVNIEIVLQCCLEVDFILNWDRCHFPVQDGIVIDHLFSREDKGKVEMSDRLPPLMSVK